MFFYVCPTGIHSFLFMLHLQHNAQLFLFVTLSNDTQTQRREQELNLHIASRQSKEEIYIIQLVCSCKLLCEVLYVVGLLILFRQLVLSNELVSDTWFKRLTIMRTQTQLLSQRFMLAFRIVCVTTQLRLELACSFHNTESI